MITAVETFAQELAAKRRLAEKGSRDSANDNDKDAEENGLECVPVGSSHKPTLSNVSSDDLGSSSAGKIQRFDEEATCPICMETLIDTVELGCSHRFCWRCFVLGPIQRANANYQLTKCPVCRVESTAKQYRIQTLISRFLSKYMPYENLLAIDDG